MFIYHGQKTIYKFRKLQIFQQLPMYIRTRVLKGKVIFCRDEKVLYEVAIQTIKEFEDYEKIYDEYLQDVARG